MKAQLKLDPFAHRTIYISLSSETIVTREFRNKKYPITHVYYFDNKQKSKEVFNKLIVAMNEYGHERVYENECIHLIFEELMRRRMLRKLKNILESK